MRSTEFRLIRVKKVMSLEQGVAALPTEDLEMKQHSKGFDDLSDHEILSRYAVELASLKSKLDYAQRKDARVWLRIVVLTLSAMMFLIAAALAGAPLSSEFASYLPGYRANVSQVTTAVASVSATIFAYFTTISFRNFINARKVSKTRDRVVSESEVIAQQALELLEELKRTRSTTNV